MACVAERSDPRVNLRQFQPTNQPTALSSDWDAAGLTRRHQDFQTRPHPLARALALKVIHKLDGSTQVRRADVVQQLQGDVAQYSERDVDDMIKKLHRAKLVRSQQGPHARVQIA